MIVPFFFLLAGSCSSKPVNVLPDGRRIPADFAGVVHAGMTNTSEEFDLITYMGIKWILHTFNWSSIEPEQGQWNFDRYETFVENAKARNINVIGVWLMMFIGFLRKAKKEDTSPPVKFLNSVITSGQQSSVLKAE